ncbi:transcriptional activator rfah factor [Caudoviricetes sp.]|nr:transcriptional activator rfah factor [Caudoviricetes sp.]
MKTYCFRVQSGTELKAQAILTGHGLIGTNPVAYEYRRANRDGVKVVEAVPQLRGYYVGLVPDDIDWATILELRNPITNIRILGKPISYDGSLRPLDPLSILQIRKLQGLEPESPQVEMQRGLKVGDTIVIRGGLHDGLRTKVKRISRDGSKGQFVVGLLKLFASWREVTIAAANSELVDDAA